MEKPILFNTAMVQAILEGNKTSTRRIMKPQPTSALTALKTLNKMPYQVGDTLYVRETWCKIPNIRAFRTDIWFKADYKDGELDELIKEFPKVIKWKPSIHMPKVAARLFLKVTAVKIQRLKDITEPEALKEGFISTAVTNPEGDDYTGLYAHEHFINVWDEIYFKQGNGWDFNPWVWVIEFERIENYVQ